MNVNVQVAVRCRPLSLKELNRNCKSIVAGTNKSIHIEGLDGAKIERDFAFDHCYFKDTTQDQVYQDIGKPLIMKALEGYNGTVFAYGQTGTGKSHCMMGSAEDPGIIPRLNDELWQSMQARVTESQDDVKYLVSVSFLEIYNEDIKDLLFRSDKQLKIRESPELGIFVEGLCELVVHNAVDVIRLIEQGNTIRRVAATNMNDKSSRSHSVFIIRTERKTTSQLVGGVTRELLAKAKLNLIDLAGSERADKTGATGNTLKEGIGINSSLTALGNVINALSEGKKHIPYRDSKLTRLLQESLGGNSGTVMIATISPADYNYDETVSTLKYANRAKSIANVVSRNEDLTERVIRDLKGQIEQLKEQLAKNQAQTIVDPELEKKLTEMERQQQSAWDEKERLSRMLEEERQRNMNSVIGDMMNQVKEQKLARIKNLNQMTQEKTTLSKKFMSDKDSHTKLTQSINDRMRQYQTMREEYDKLMTLLPQETNSDKSKQMQTRCEQLSKAMDDLAMMVDKSKQEWNTQRETLEKIKNRLNEINDSMIDQKAELVTFSGILDQNDQLRMKIQDEEKKKVKVEYEQVIERLKQQYEQDRQSNESNEELHGTIEQLNKEIIELRTELGNQIVKYDQLNDELSEQWKYTADIEKQLGELSELQIKQENEYRMQLQDKDDEVVKLQEKYQRDLKIQMAEMETVFEAKLQEEKYNVYKSLMISFMEDATELQSKNDDLKVSLKQATGDLMHMMKQNEELKELLHQALNYEPTAANRV